MRSYHERLLPRLLETFSLMILHYDRSTPGESLIRYIMLWNPKYEAEVLQREPITSNEKTLVMQLGPTSLKRIALSYSLPRGTGIFSPQTPWTFFYLSHTLWKGQLGFIRKTRELKVSTYLTRSHSETSVVALFNIIKLPVPLLSSVGPFLFPDPGHSILITRLWECLQGSKLPFPIFTAAFSY